MDFDEENNAGFEVVFRATDDADDNVSGSKIPSNGITSDTSATDPQPKILSDRAYHWSKNMDGNSSVSMVPLQEGSPLRETHSDPFKKPGWWREASSLSVIIGSMILFCVAITIAMIVQILIGAPQVIPHAAVLSDDAECSKIGLEILRDSKDTSESLKNAPSVDAAIMTLLCLMVKNPHKGGIGGGGFMLIEKQHDAKRHLTEINFREMSPADVDVKLNISRDQVTAAKSIAVPGFIKGMKSAHDIFNIKRWKTLFDKAATIAAKGVSVSKELAEAIQKLDLASIPEDLKALVTSDGSTKLKENDTLIQPELAQTLKAIAEDPNTFYSGGMAKSIVANLTGVGANITLDDMMNYETEVKSDVLSIAYKNMSIAATNIPSSGPVLLSTLNYLASNKSLTSVNTQLYHNMLEALKYSYGYQARWNGNQFNDSLRGASELEEIKRDNVSSLGYYTQGFQPLHLNSGGEQHVTVIGHDRHIVTVVTGIGSPFGSKVMTSGFVMNNAMLDFSWNGKNLQYNNSDLKPSQTNFLAPKKRPASSMFASLVLPNNTKCGLYLGFDAHQWTSAISSSVQVIVKTVFGNNIQTSIDEGRIDQNMAPFGSSAENSFPNKIRSGLAAKGHDISNASSIGVCSVLSYLDGHLSFYGDKRDEEDSASMF